MAIPWYEPDIFITVCNLNTHILDDRGIFSHKFMPKYNLIQQVVGMNLKTDLVVRDAIAKFSSNGNLSKTKNEELFNSIRSMI